MIEKEIKISGMNCNHCVMAVKKEISKLEVANTEVTIGNAKVLFDEQKVSEASIEAAIVEAGFQVVK